jgi:uncharacterized protein (DUF58 family)
MATDRLRHLQAWAERRMPALTRYRRPEALPIALHRRRIYIVPTAFGSGFALLLLVMLVGALNYANNAALLLTCLVAAACAASMLVAFRSLDGLSLRSIQAGQAVAGEPIALTLELDSGGQPRSAIRLDVAGSSQAFALKARGSTRVIVLLPTEQRGWLTLPRLRLWSTWPLGLFRAWSWLHPQMPVLVWPRAEAHGPPPVHASDNLSLARPRQGDDLAGLRNYRTGDPPRRIAWKASARHNDLLVKEYEQPHALEQWRLDWRAMPGLDKEARIARLARWLGEAEAQHRQTSLWLPGEDIPLGSGPIHYAHCMSALAKLP